MNDQGAIRKPIKLAMMVDDEEVDQMICERIIRRYGLVEKIVCFSDAQDALEFLQGQEQGAVDVVFLDINMPKMSGFEFLEKATESMGPHFTRLCAIMLTTTLNPNDQARAEKYEAVRLFSDKPLKVEHIENVAAILAET